MKASRIIPIAIILILITLLTLTQPIARAQDAPEPPAQWTEPINLSQSGAAGAPQLLRVGDQYLAFWRDTIDGFRWTRGDGANWQPPAGGEFPFATRAYSPDLQPEAPTPTYTPHLIAHDNTIHAIWRDDQSRLYHSAVPVSGFADFNAWQPRQQLAASAIDRAAAITVDSSGNLHLAYIQAATATATAGGAPGLYHRRSLDGGDTWSDPIILHDSPYLRLITPDTANIHITPGPANHIFIVAGNPARDQILFFRTTSNGQTWTGPIEIDRRQETDSNSAQAPANARIAVHNDAIHITWQAGHDGLTCAQYHQTSTDNGETWQTRQRILPNLTTCPTTTRFLNTANALLLIAASGPDHYLLTWQNDQWSDPLLQTQLRTIADPQTFRPVELNCGLALTAHDDTIALAACGQANAQDIWFLSRPLTPLLQSLTTTPVWSTPAPLLDTPDQTQPPPAPIAPLLIPDQDGTLHAFWTSPQNPAHTIPTHIYYARHDGARWSRPIPIVGDQDTGSQAATQHPAALLTPQGRILLAWSGSASGEPLYSLAAAPRAGEQSEWTQPRPLLPAITTAAPAAPALLLAPTLDGQTAIHAAITIPLNEQRGAYLTTSYDGGETWTQPTTIFTPAEDDENTWPMIDAPRLAHTAPGHLHALFTQRTPPGAAPQARLFYTRSDDDGATWTAPQPVTNGTPQQHPIAWSTLLTGPDRTLHRLWQENDATRLNLWHQHSTDHGLTWTRPARIGGLGQSSGPAIALSDPAHIPHLLQLLPPNTPGDPHTLHHDTWDPAEQRWLQNTPITLPQPGPQTLHTPAIAAAFLHHDQQPDAALAVLISNPGDPTPLLHLSRPITLPATLPTPLPTLTPTPQPTPGPTATPPAAPTPTVTFPTEPGDGVRLNILPGVGANTLAFGALIALLPAAALLIIVLILINRRARK